MSKKHKKAETTETPETTDTAAPPVVPIADLSKPLTDADIIRLGNIDTNEEIVALRKAVENVRPDIIATDGNRQGEGRGRFEVRYGNGRAFRQRPGETEAHFFANARSLVLSVLGQLQVANANVSNLSIQVKDRCEQITKLTEELNKVKGDLNVAKTDLATMIAERDAAQAELAKVAGELAVLKLNAPTETVAPESPAETPAETPATVTA